MFSNKQCTFVFVVFVCPLALVKASSLSLLAEISTTTFVAKPADELSDRPDVLTYFHHT